MEQSLVKLAGWGLSGTVVLLNRSGLRQRYLKIPLKNGKFEFFPFFNRRI
jgi:hypothetical protein